MNGSDINKEEVDRCHRKFVSYYDEVTEKPQRYFEIKTRLQNKLKELLRSKRNAKTEKERNSPDNKQIGKQNKNIRKTNKVMYHGNTYINTLRNSTNKNLFSMWIPAD